MNTLSTIKTALIDNILSSLMPAILAVLGALLVLVVSVWGALWVYAYIKGKDSSYVYYKVGRIFGSLVYEEQYAAYKIKRDKLERQRSFRRRYDKG